MEGEWIDIKKEMPTKEGYYEVKFSNGVVDEKPFRIRPKQHIHGFMTLDKITHWRPLQHN